RLIRTLQGIAPSQAQSLLLSLPPELLTTKATLRNLQDFIKQLQAYHYPHACLTRFIELLDMSQLAQHYEQVSLQSLFWTLHTLKKVSPVRAQTLLQSIPLPALSIKASISNLGSLD